MKHSFYYFLILAAFATACSPSQKVTSYWVNKDANKGPYQTIYIIAMTQNENMEPAVENSLADVLISKGHKVVMNSQVYPPSFSAVKQLTREQLAETISGTGSNGVLTLAVLDTKTETTYNPGTTYAPMNYGYYGSYYGYYNHYYPVVYSPGYYTENKTYYIETNFFDIESDALIWSIQSQALNPANFDSMFEEYTQIIISKLREEGMIK
jgi:hypothetical protein